MKPSPLLLSKLWLLPFLLLGQKTFAAACCGGGFAAPSVIVSDDRAQLTGSYSYGEIDTDVYASGLWRKRDSSEAAKTFRIEGAHILSDRWQVGLTVPVIERARQNNSSAGLGDVAATLGYEYLPDWDYHPIRPKGIGFLQLTAPSGKSIYESDDLYGLDSRGRGFWALGAGTILTKVISKWDVFSTLEAHHSFSKSYGNSQSSGTILPGQGGSFGIGGGYNLSDWRLGAVLTWTYEDPVNVSGSISSQGSVQRFATGSLAASYMIDATWAATVNYADQTLFGTPVNTSLGKVAMLMLQKRWAR